MTPLVINTDLDVISTVRALTRANNRARLFCRSNDAPACYAEHGDWGRLVVTVDGPNITVAMQREAPLFGDRV
jgi:hypothetical protein